MSAFEEAGEKQFLAFIANKTDDFGTWPIDPDRFTPFATQVADGFTITSAGGMCPFQAEGQITALATDGDAVPMRWHYRAGGGSASLNVAITQEEAYGPNPLYSAGMASDEFDDSHWLEQIAVLIPQLAPVPYLYYFATLRADFNGQLHPAAAAARLGVRALVEAHSAGDDRFVGLSRHALVSYISGRGNTVEEALVNATTFSISHYLVENGFSEEPQRIQHAAAVAHLDPKPFNPYLGLDDVDNRMRPTVQLAKRPFRTKEQP